MVFIKQFLCARLSLLLRDSTMTVPSLQMRKLRDNVSGQLPWGTQAVSSEAGI